MDHLVRQLLGPLASVVTGVIVATFVAIFILGVHDKEVQSWFAIGGGILGLAPEALKLAVWFKRNQ